MNLLWYYIIYIFVINILGFFNMKWDKEFAKKGTRRTSEKALMTYALLLGGIGIYYGMYKFRHKTKHTKFVIGVPVCIILNIICSYYIITYIISH